MAQKQITELENADNLEDGDLILIRKSAQGVDRKLTRAKLIESIGHSAVNGYTALSDAENKITLAASNSIEGGVVLPQYYDGMKVSFITPITTNGLVQIQIGALQYVDLKKFNTDETVLLDQGEYIEAIYINDSFKQTNKLNTNLVWSNEYTATGEVAENESTTTYTLTSAIGVQKTEYYTGMSLLFTVPVDSIGSVRVNVDELGLTDLNDGPDDHLVNQVYKDELIMAIYNGTEFVKRQFPTLAQPIPEVLEETEIIVPPVIEEDIWAESYSGNPDDPANAAFPNDNDSQGQAFFVKTLRVGSSGADYVTLDAALIALINEYGDTGGGRRVAIQLLTNYVPTPTNDSYIRITGKKSNADLRWISIFSEGNSYINFDKATFYCTCDYTPIFNFKMSINRSVNINSSWNWGFYIADTEKKTTVTFGKNTDIIFRSTGSASKTSPLLWGSPNIVALSGFKAQSTNPLTRGGYFINHGDFTFENAYGSGNFLTCNSSTDSKIYNSVFKCSTGVASTLIATDSRSDLYLQNVESTDRKSTTKGLVSAGTTTMKNCRFASPEASTKHDIVINGNTETRLFLDSVTTGSLSPGEYVGNNDNNVSLTSGRIIRT